MPLSEKFCEQKKQLVRQVLKGVVSVPTGQHQIPVDCERTQAYFASIGSGYTLMMLLSPLVDVEKIVAIKLMMVPIPKQ